MRMAAEGVFPMMYVKASIAALVAAFVVFAYTAIVMSIKVPNTIGKGVVTAYFGNAFFWVTLVVVSLYAFRITTHR